MAPANPSRLPQVLLLAAVGLALMAASAAADDAVAASTAGQDPWRKGETWPTFKGPRGKDKRPIFSSFKEYSAFCDKTWPDPNTPAGCKPPKGSGLKFNPKRMPKGVLPYGACTGRPLDHKEHTINKDANATRPAKPVPPPKKYQPAKSSGNQGKPWGYGKPAGRRLLSGEEGATVMRAAHVRATRTHRRLHQAGGGADQCPGLQCVTNIPSLALDFSLPLDLPDGSTLDLGEVIDPSTIVNDFLALTGGALCDLSFSGADIASGAWLAQLIGRSNSSLAQKAGSLVPLFNKMPLRQDVNYLIMGFPAGIPPSTGKDGAPASKLDKVKGVLGLGVGVALNPCTLDLHLQFFGLSAGPIPLGSSGLELTLSADSVGFSRDGLIPSNLDKIGLNRRFFTPTGFRDVPAAAPTGHLYFQGSGAVSPAALGALQKFVTVSFKATLKALINTDPLNDNQVGVPASFDDFRVLANLDAAPVINLGGKIPLELGDIFQARTNLYLANDNDGFTLAAGLNITQGGLGGLLGKLVTMPVEARDAISAIFNAGQIGSPVLLKGLNVFAGAEGWALRVELAAGNTGVMAGIGPMLDLIRLAFPQVPRTVGGTFGISGRTQGNGLPIGATLGLNGVGDKTLYFCSTTADCPSGSSCQLGLCSTTTCGSGTFPTSAVSCSLAACPPGFVNTGLTCAEQCKAGEVDQGATCAACPAGKEYDAGLCYTPCDRARNYYPVGPVCWQRCGAGFTDIGALCRFNGRSSFGKGCCCIKAFGRDNGCCGCPANMNDAGCFCYPTTIWKSSYGRGVGTVPGIRNKQSISRIVIPTVTLPN